MALESIEGWRGREGVTHVAISETGGYALGESPPGMVVFWWNDRPAGHLFVDHANAQGAFGNVDPQVLAAIKAEDRSAAPARQSASIVICTRDRPEELQRCLASLPQQSYPPREIIVVDNASRDQRTERWRWPPA